VGDPDAEQSAQAVATPLVRSAFDQEKDCGLVHDPAKGWRAVCVVLKVVAKTRGTEEIEVIVEQKTLHLMHSPQHGEVPAWWCQRELFSPQAPLQNELAALAQSE
jgi:hypothetical protein